MAGDDLAVIGNQHWIAETEALDRRCDLLDLGAAMTSRVSRIGLKRLNRYTLERWIELSYQELQAPNRFNISFNINCANNRQRRRSPNPVELIRKGQSV